MRLARIAGAIVLLYIVVAIYAPFLASGQPLFALWNGQIHFPLLRDLLTTQKPIDLFFNLLALTLPLMLLVRRWGRGPLYTAIAGNLLIFGLLVAFPLRPGDGPLHEVTSFWRDRVQHERIEQRYGSAYASRYEGALPTSWNRRVASQEQAVAAWRAHGDVQRAERLEQQWSQLQEGSGQLSYVLMPLLRPFDAYEEAGGSQRLNRVVAWWDLTRLNRSDLVASLFYGTRVSLLVGAGAVLIALALAIPLGAIAGYWGRGCDLALSRLIEIWEALPLFFMLLLAIAIAQAAIASGLLDSALLTL